MCARDIWHLVMEPRSPGAPVVTSSLGGRSQEADPAGSTRVRNVEGAGRRGGDRRRPPRSGLASAARRLTRVFAEKHRRCLESDSFYLLSVTLSVCHGAGDDGTLRSTRAAEPWWMGLRWGRSAPRAHGGARRGGGGASSDRAWGLTSAGTRGGVGAPGLERDHADHAGKGGLGLLGASLTRLTRGSVTGVSCNLAESSLSDGVQPRGLSPARCGLAEAGGAESLSSRWPCHENTQSGHRLRGGARGVSVWELRCARGQWRPGQCPSPAAGAGPCIRYRGSSGRGAPPPGK